MKKTYEYTGQEQIVKLLQESFAESLDSAGYSREVEVVNPGAPHVYEYRKDDAVISVTVDDTAGEKWEASIVVETEEAAEDVTDAVVGAVGGLLADLSGQLIESIRDAEIRSEVARGLTSVIASLK